MFLVNWLYALFNLAAVFIVWFYIGRANPGVAPGVTADFHFFTWLRNSLSAMCGFVCIVFTTVWLSVACPVCLCSILSKCCRRSPRGYEEIIISRAIHMEVEASQLTEENEDFASRSRYHQTSTVHGRNLDNRPEDELALVP